MKKYIITIIALTFSMAMLQDSYAQEGSDVFMLEEITVTAQKREENLQKVPMAMETISGAELTETGKLDILGALSGVSSALVQLDGEDFNISIRGMDNDQAYNSSVSMVAVNVDGTYTGNYGTAAPGLYDMDRIEILAGPQGTLYSRNSTGGVVNLVSKDPSEKYEAAGTMEFGNYNLMHTEGMVNAPLADQLDIRTAFSSIVRDGYISNGTNDQDTKSGRLKLKYKPKNNLSVVMAAEFTRTGGKGAGSGVTAFEEQPDDEDEAWVSDSPSDIYVDYDMARYYVDLDWDLNFGELTFLTSYRDNDMESKSELVSIFSVVDSDEESFSFTYTDISETSAELRMTSPADSKIKWLMGLYHYERELYTVQNPDEPDSMNYMHKDSGILSSSAFGNMTYPVSDTLRLNIGGRLTWDDEETATHRKATAKKSDHFDYKLGFEYDIAQHSMLWADYSTGFRQGMQAQANEYLDAYQAGVKNRFLDQRLQVNATAFLYIYENYQVTSTKNYTYTDIDGNVYSTMDRGEGFGDAELYGIDVQSNYILTEKDRIDLSISYLHTEISDLFIEYEYGDIATGFEGRVLNNSPEWTLVASYEHRFALVNGGDITARANMRYRTESQVEFFYTGDGLPEGMDKDKVNTEPANHISNVSATYQPPEGKWNLTAYVKNIENHATKTGIGMTGEIKIGTPRTYGAVLSISY